MQQYRKPISQSELISEAVTRGGRYVGLLTALVEFCRWFPPIARIPIYDGGFLIR
jgi:hypothetical protein